MNIPNGKDAFKPLNRVNDISGKIIKQIKDGDVQGGLSSLRELRIFRALFDQQHPNLSAKLSQILQEAPEELRESIKSVSNSVIRNLELIESWREHTLEQNSELPQAIIAELILPTIWDYTTDFVIIFDEKSLSLSEELKAQGQENIIFIPSALEVHNANIDTIKSTDDLKEIYSKPIKGRSRVYPLGTTENESQEALYKSFLDFTMSRNSDFNTTLTFSERWVKQQIGNIPNFLGCFGVDRLYDTLKDKNIMVVSPGPSLALNIETLKEYRSKFVVIATAQVAQALERHDIFPDFFIAIDPTDYTAVFQGFDVTKCKGIILSEVCHANFFKLPFPRRFIIAAPQLDSISTICIPIRDNLPPTRCVSTQAVQLAISAKAASVTLIGQDLAIGERKYYFRSGFDDVDGPATAQTLKTERPLIPVKSISDGYVECPTDYYLYKHELELFATQHSDSIDLYNVTAEGAHIEGFKHLSLERLQDAFQPVEIDMHAVSDTSLQRKLLLRECHAALEKLRNIREQAKKCRKLSFQFEKTNDHKLSQKLSAQEEKLSTLIESNRWLKLLSYAREKMIFREIQQVSSIEQNLALSRTYYNHIIEVSTLIADELSPAVKKLRSN